MIKPLQLIELNYLNTIKRLTLNLDLIKDHKLIVKLEN